MQINAVNENSVILYFGDVISAEVADTIGAAVPLIRAALNEHLVDIVPSYTSILVTFDLMAMDCTECIAKLTPVLANITSAQSDKEPSRLIEIPVYYGKEVALDADDVCEHTGLNFEEVVRLHTSEAYRVYAIGFTPGFAYLGNTPTELEIARKKTPRLSIPKGSVALADRQTAIYPKVSPGGWQVIGKTPMELIDYQRANLSLFEMGAKVIFKAITREEFIELGGSLDSELNHRHEGNSVKKPQRDKEIA